MAYVFDQLGYLVNPQPMAKRRDVIQAIQLGSPQKLIALCKAIQQHSPVGFYLDSRTSAELGGQGQPPLPMLCK